MGETYDGELSPYLRALVGDDGEADEVFFKTHPTYLSQGGEGGG